MYDHLFIHIHIESDACQESNNRFCSLEAARQPGGDNIRTVRLLGDHELADKRQLDGQAKNQWSGRS